MTRLSSLALLTAAAVAFAAPALAKISVQGAQSLCKAEVVKQNPNAKSVKVDQDSVRATSGDFSYLFKVKGADDVTAKLICTVDRSTETVSAITPAN